MTPAELAAELGQTERWIVTHMRTGDIPSVKVGRARYFTPECRAALVARQVAEAAIPANKWGRATRKRSS
jgi:hypothetical protein